MAKYILTDMREHIITSKRTRKPFEYSSERVALIAARVFGKQRRKAILVWEKDDFYKEVDPNLTLKLEDMLDTQ